MIENIAEKKITDFVSFYNLPSQILKQRNHNHTMMNVSYFFNLFQKYFCYFLGCLFVLLWYECEFIDRNDEVFFAFRERDDPRWYKIRCIQLSQHHGQLRILKRFEIWYRGWNSQLLHVQLPNLGKSWRIQGKSNIFSTHLSFLTHFLLKTVNLGTVLV